MRARPTWKAYGTWSGTVVRSDGSTLHLDGLLGAAEHVELTG